MKTKFILITAIITLYSTYSFAKTEGNYVGVDLIRTEIKGNDNEKEHKISGGLNYEYAFNMNNFFIAPGAFFDYSNDTAKTKNTESGVEVGANKIGLDYRYGARVNFGYDFNKFAVYANIGLAENHYTVDIGAGGIAQNGAKKSGNDLALAYGIGAKYSVTDRIDVKLGYEMSKFNMRYPANEEGYGKEKFKLNVIRFGAAYKF